MLLIASLPRTLVPALLPFSLRPRSRASGSAGRRWATAVSEPRRGVWAGLEEARGEGRGLAWRRRDSPRSLGTLAVWLRTRPLRLPQGREAESPPLAPGEGEGEPPPAGREARGAGVAQAWACSAASGRGLGQPEVDAGQPRVGRDGSQGSGATRATPAWLCRQLGLGPPRLGFLRSRPGPGGSPGCSLGLPRGAGGALTCL
ncbi:unnamed protein product [Rangifer tarandus platyrhynchus]|uniref:Uncharacterized protein n=2 Tax=Rangifer tarandus platyrhynchus TaxID=3082113 RepID=A0ABN8YXP9_RANTA|nr:unnamed protein product [Rangifer tarandus platyrhynchus]CAI9693634.1 unnamed protein product [Rangifer tarandus platyrhynchus]